MLSKYDLLTGRELKDLFTKRYGTNRGTKKLPMNRNHAGYKYRLFFIQEDLKKGINPYLSPDHNKTSPLSVCNPLQQLYLSEVLPSSPSQTSDD